MNRRQFSLGLGGAALSAAQERKERPNILWITCEDIGPQLGCYGDRYADTPNLDALAAKGMRYRFAWSNAPVCAPARTTIISDMYPTSTGSENMRSETRLPEGMKMYPCYLRESGYYVTNNSKEDYNLVHTGRVWDESSPKAHWRNRKPGQPFFAVFNFLTTHESQIRTRPHQFVHDPAGVRVPAYHPDAPEVRQDWAQYYDNITTMDGQAAGILKQLEADGLAENTIVFFYGDHGSGMPRSKRWPYNSGLQVPLIVYIPEKWRHLAPPEYKTGGVSERLAAFVDLAPTLLSLAGIKPPLQMQGHALMGQYEAAPQKYVYGFRGRMDERLDLVRSVSDGRYVYIRNYMPHKIYGQHIAYMFETPTARVWKAAYDAGTLKPEARHFWEPKPPEELYDLTSDRDEVHNLAASPGHRQLLQRMRSALRDWLIRTRDVGFLPENEIHSRGQRLSPYDVGHDPKQYPFERVLETAEMASSLEAKWTPGLVRRLADSDSAVRYWAALGLLMRGSQAFQDHRPAVLRLLDDQAAAPRIAAGEIVGRFGSDEEAGRALNVLLQLAPPEKNGFSVSILALNAISNFPQERRRLAQDTLASMPARDPKAPQKVQEYVPALLAGLVPGWKAKP